MISFAPSHGEAPSEVDVHGSQLSVCNGGSMVFVASFALTIPPDRLLGPEPELLPPRRGRAGDVNQSLKIREAIKAHMPSGYAAVGEMLNPPSLLMPIVFCLWLWPQKRGSGPLE